MTERRFTVEEAQALLPQLSALLKKLREAHRTMSERQDGVVEGARGNGGGDAGNEFLTASMLAADITRDIQRMGVLLRDPDTGLVDFPFERDGREAFLCWRLGEPAVAWWHPPETGIAGRVPL